MAHILPFKAVRPAESKAELLTSRSYESYSPEEKRRVLKNNPFSFLQIINPEDGYGNKLKGSTFYSEVRNRYREFLQEGLLVRDEEPCLYVYELLQNGRRFMGVVCATGCEDYRSNVIRRHEDTISRREWVFARFLKAVRFNAEPVLMFYPDNALIGKILEYECSKIPLYNFNDPERGVHKLWQIKEPGTINQLQQLFKSIEALYIADGHHRTASSNLMATEAAASGSSHNGREAYNYFMSFLMPESMIGIATYNRMVTDLHGHSVKTFLSGLLETFRVSNMGSQVFYPSVKHSFSMYLGGNFYRLELREESWAFTDPLNRLDSHILYQTILKPMLGIEDLRNNRRLGYSFDENPAEHMKAQIDKGEFVLGFAMAPVGIADIRAIADAGLVMPPKSTYIEPKLRSGLVIYEF